MARRWRVLRRRKARKANQQPFTPPVSVHYFDDYQRYDDSDDYEYDDDGHGGDCYWCGGEGWVDGYEDDPLWFEPGEMERCSSCGGSGRAKDMTIW